MLRRRRTGPPAKRAAMPTVLVHSDTTKSLAELEDRLASSRGIFSKVRSLTKTGALNAEELDVVEEVLLRSDVGLATTNEILDVLRRDGAPLGVTSALRELLLRFLDAERSLRYDASENHVAVWLFVGVNGVGKTTTIGKLAQRLSNEGRTVLLAAGDTFRAAAAEQLEQWASRSGADIVRSSEGADPGSVVHDAIGRAFAKGSTMVLADTAGRRSNSTNLLDELSKIRRVADRTPGEVLETLLVLDATTGQNALAQAREFLRAASVTGIVLTKLDGTARGGIVVAIEKELAIPVKFVGVGEGVDDLIPFDPATFVDSLLEP